MSTKRSYILKQTCSSQLMVCLSVYDILVDLKLLRVEKIFPANEYFIKIHFYFIKTISLRDFNNVTPLCPAHQFPVIVEWREINYDPVFFLEVKLLIIVFENKLLIILSDKKFFSHHYLKLTNSVTRFAFTYFNSVLYFI